MRIDNIIKRLIQAQEDGVTHVKIRENQILAILPNDEYKQIIPMPDSEKVRNYEYSKKPITVDRRGSRPSDGEGMSDGAASAYDLAMGYNRDDINESIEKLKSEFKRHI